MAHERRFPRAVRPLDADALGRADERFGNVQAAVSAGDAACFEVDERFSRAGARIESQAAFVSLGDIGGIEGGPRLEGPFFHTCRKMPCLAVLAAHFCEIAPGAAVRVVFVEIPGA